MLLEDRVNERLEALGKKKSWLISHMDMATSTFWRKISGKTALSYEEMQMLAEGLECSPEYLTGVTDKPSRKENSGALPEKTKSRATLDLEMMVRDLAAEHPDLILLFRDTRERWEELSDKDKRAIADGMAFVLGRADAAVESRMKKVDKNSLI